jgi:Family of unknown function (DUF5683)
MTRSRIIILLLLFACTSPAMLSAQKTDSVSAVNKRANKAALMSALLPGLGQAYNKSYWKIPVLYAGLGTLVYFVRTNDEEYQNFYDAYKIRLDGDSTTNDMQYPNLSDEDILVRKDYYRRNRDLSYILIGVVYVLNIVDAYVDAQLKDFDISDNLSLKTSPWLAPGLEGKHMAGLSLRLSFH